MATLNKVSGYLFIIHLSLTIIYVIYSNKMSTWLFDKIVMPSENFTSELFNYYNDVYFLSVAIFQLMLIGFFIFIMRILKSYGQWLEPGVETHLLNRLVISKLVGVIFLGRYILYMINDFAYLLDVNSGDYKLTRGLWDANLYVQTGSSQTIENPSIRTYYSIMLIFLRDIVFSLIYAIYYYGIFAIYTYRTSNYESSNSETYPKPNMQKTSL